MKVLILGSKEYPMGTSDDPISSGGIEVYTENLVEHLWKKTEIIIITRMFEGTEGYEKDGLEVYRVPWIKGFYLRTPSFNFFGFLKALSLDFDVILAQGPISTFFGIILSKIKRKPLISRPAGMSYTQPQYNKVISSLFRRLEMFTYSKPHTVIFLSEREKEQFEKKLGYLPSKYEVIPTGVNLERINEAKPQIVMNEFSLKDTSITFLGRLIGVKGIEYLIRAVSTIDGEFKVLIVGDGPAKEKLQNMADEMKVEGKVIFTGWRQDVPSILKASDIFVLPSLSEGLPIALLEAMAAGCACVVTDIGLPVKNGENALVVPPRNAESLSSAIETLIRDRKLRDRLSKNAVREAKKYSWEIAVEGYIEVFKELMPEL